MIRYGLSFFDVNVPIPLWHMSIVIIVAVRNKPQPISYSMSTFIGLFKAYNE